MQVVAVPDPGAVDADDAVDELGGLAAENLKRLSPASVSVGESHRSVASSRPGGSGRCRRADTVGGDSGAEVFVAMHIHSEFARL